MTISNRTKNTHIVQTSIKLCNYNKIIISNKHIQLHWATNKQFIQACYERKETIVSHHVSTVHLCSSAMLAIYTLQTNILSVRLSSNNKIIIFHTKFTWQYEKQQYRQLKAAVKHARLKTSWSRHLFLVFHLTKETQKHSVSQRMRFWIGSFTDDHLLLCDALQPSLTKSKTVKNHKKTQ